MSSATAEQAMRLSMAGRLHEAAELFDSILRRDPENFDALHGLAIVRSQQGEFAPAESLLAHALALRPGSAELLYNRGSLLHKLGRNQDALTCLDAALAVRSDYPEALGNRGALLMDLGRHDEALADFNRLTAARPAWPQAWSNLGTALMKLGRHREAVASYGRAIMLKPDFVEARRARAWAAFSLRQFAEALSDIGWIVARNPDDPLAWQQRGDILAATGRREAAVESYGRAIALRPDWPDALFNRASNLFCLRQFQAAAQDYAAAVRLDREYRYGLGHLIFAKLCCCDWQDLDRLIAELRAGLRAGRIQVQPFHALVTVDAEEDILAATRTFAATEFPATATPLAQRVPYAHGRIRIGYLSGNFHSHAVSRQMAGVFEHHDRSRFDVTAFSLGPDDGTALRARLVPAFGEFLDVANWDDRRIAQEIHHREIDVLVDLMGFTENSRPAISAQRPAPIQINYLGYPGTMAADHMDYLIADGIVIPASSSAHYQEQIIRLPHCYLPQDQAREIAAAPVSRAAAGLPDRGFVFCCFNHSYKITREIFDVWIRLLGATPDSVLWLNQLDPAAQNNLKEHAQAKGIDPARIVYAPFVGDDSEHLARLRAADLFLDTPGYNAHATASDALWVGLPVLTVKGSTFPARVGESLLRAIGMEELIARDLDNYEQSALSLAQDRDRLTAMRRKLQENARTKPLFDTSGFTRHLEFAYQSVFDRLRQGLGPASFAVPEAV